MVAKLKRKKESVMLYRNTEKIFDSERLCIVVPIKVMEHPFVVYAADDRTTPIYTFKEDSRKDILMKNSKEEIVARIQKKSILAADAAATYIVGDLMENGNIAMKQEIVENYDIKVA